MKFKINSTPADGSRIPPIAKWAIALIGKLPDGELLDSWNLCGKLGCHYNSLAHFNRLIPDTLQAKNRAQNIYGNPKTIAAWKARSVQD